jgi:pimeloyl-ACP methyl ester carboxylesterase
MTTMNANQDHGSAYTTHLFGGLSGRLRVASGKQLADAPLVIAIHGGTYTSAYFDLPGYSLLARAAALGVPALALDRPGYGESPSLPLGYSSIQDQADALIAALEDAWRQYGATTRGIVLIGHSIGGAIAISIAARSKTLPLIGLAVSGVGLRVPPHFPDQWRALPEGPTVEFPVHLKDMVMFGPEGSFDDSMPVASHAADSLAPRQEIIDIVTTWPDVVRDVVRQVRIPVHYRQAEVDHLWIVDQTEVEQFGKAFTASPHVDSAMVRKTGHCMDFHRIGAALQAQQLGFALQCAVEGGEANASGT